MSETRVVVVGAGIAGLVSALDLAHQGLSVTVVERAAEAGGKIHVEQADGQDIDSGPTVFTMRWVFDEWLQTMGLDLDRELQLTPLSVLARHFWFDGSSLDLYADPLASEAAVEQMAGPDEAQRFRQFCQQAREMYGLMDAPFIRHPLQSLPRFMASLGPRGLALLARMGPTQTLWSSLGRQFRDPRLRQLFARYATYCGSSPLQAPATLSLIAQVEMDGVWTVDGGMQALVRCLTRLCQQKGVRFRYQTECQDILVRRGRVHGVRLAQGEELAAERVVFNGDAAALRLGLLGQAAQQAVRPSRAPRSLSAVTWSLRARTRGLALDRHNLFFQRDYEKEFHDIFQDRRLPRWPTVYLCAQDRPHTANALDHERLLCLINAPANGDETAFSAQALADCEAQARGLMQQCGLDIDWSSGHPIRNTPQTFHRRFPGTGGALYGQATHGWMSIFSRPGAISPIPGLFLAGGSVHPGPGVPMAAMSGRLAAAAVKESLASIKSSPLAAISGGMSTP